MRGGLVVSGSAILHAAVIAWICDRVSSRRPAAPPLPSVPRPPPPTPSITAIDLIQLAPDPSEAAVTTRAADASRGVAAPRSISAAAGTAEHTTPTGSESVQSHVLAMRGPRDQLSISEDALARAIGADRPLPAPVPKTGRLAPSGFGEHTIYDAVATVRVHADGTVDLDARPDIDAQWQIRLPTLSGLREIGRDIARWYADPYADQRAGRWTDLPRHLQATPGSCDRWGDPLCDANDTPASERAEADAASINKGLSGDATIKTILSGRLDLTSALAHALGAGDVYSSRKLKLLDDTRAERVQIGAEHGKQQLDRAAELMERNLEALWRATTDPRERKRALFELWDECFEGEGDAGQAGERARALLIGWIGKRLPFGSPAAFTAAEIVELDGRRTSNQHFAPYP